MAVSSPVRCSTHSMTLRMGLRRSDFELASVDFHHIAIERAGRWAGQHFAVDRKRGGMAGANESVRWVVPVIGTTQVCTVGGKGSDLTVRLFYHPSRRFFADHFPAIHAIALKGDFGWRADGQGSQVGGLNPLFFLA